MLFDLIFNILECRSRHLYRVLNSLEPEQGVPCEFTHMQQVIVLIHGLMEEDLIVEVELQVLPVEVLGEELLKEVLAVEELHLYLS